MTASEWLIDESEALAAAATQGPWKSSYVRESAYNPSVITADAEDVVAARHEQWIAEASPARLNGRADAAFIAHARTALPKRDALLRKVFHLHARDGDFCRECRVAYPCPTIRLVEEGLR